MRASASLPLTGREIYQGCRTPSIDSKFSESPKSPDLGPSSSSARDFYQGFPSSSERSEYMSPDFTDTEDEGPRCYISADIKRITSHFRKPIAPRETVQNVYSGKLVNGTTGAVKVLPSELWHSPNHFNQFKVMVMKFALLKHQNLVRIIGYCFEDSTGALVMEHRPGGNLTRFIGNSVRSNWVQKPLITWVQRLQIALDVAQGLEHFHRCCNPPMTHGNVTLTNILLDENLNAKLGEPGYTILAILRSNVMCMTSVLSFGCLSPASLFQCSKPLI